MKTLEIKQNFINFFKKNEYKELKPSPLVIENDKSLLFTNSGMVQFKNIFLGLEKYLYPRVVTIQPCVRLGGKHNDLDNIGKTPHHNTSFEMLGNFGFEKVSKEEAINLSIDFLINVLELDKKKIFITINKKDEDVLNIWLKHIKKEKIIFGDDDTNFWQMAENGPCGYCSEIFYNIDEEKKNLLEIWNLVFINFNKENGKLNTLNTLNIDTGMGLERIASIKQNVFDSFKTDIFSEKIKNMIELFKINVKDDNKNIRIIADHIKTSLMLMNENIMPSNDGRGYILKKLLRRSIIKKQELKTKTSLSTLINIFNDKYEKKDNIEIKKNIILNEELKFENTIKNGKNFIKKIIQKEKNISGQTLFTLYDTYGIPIDTIESITRESNIKLEINDFKKELEKNIFKNKLKSKKQIDDISYIKDIKNTIFLGYEKNNTDTKIIKIIIDKKETNEIKQTEKGILITQETTFYSEKGGQIGDSGTITSLENLFEVIETKEINNIYLHYGIMKNGSLKIGDDVKTSINENKRSLITNNHSATHLLNATLKKVLGNHIKQAGSLINENYLRFDFIHFKNLSLEEKNKIERIINDHIQKNLQIKVKLDSSNCEKNKFNKIKDRKIIIGEHISEELCAGTHVKTTAEIGLFKITKEFGIGNNIRRIEAITNYKIIQLLEENENIIEKINIKLKTKKDLLIEKITKLIEDYKNLEKENQSLLLENIQTQFEKNQITITNNIKIVSFYKNLINTQYINKLISNLKKTIIINLFKHKEKNVIKIILTDDLENFDAKDILNNLKKNLHCDGNGNKKIANGIIYNKVKNDEIISYIQLYLQNYKK
ncbi:MAG TPA: alanine--tRNA ligase [Candidatus Azoamicus sp.]